MLCVMAIIAILASLLLPALGKALWKARGLTGHLGSPSCGSGTKLVVFTIGDLIAPLPP
jgi:hypothetical protein